MAQKKIMFVINSLSRGGAERVLSILLDAFVKDSAFDVTLVLLEDEIAYPLPEELDIVILSTLDNGDGGLKKTAHIPLFSWRLWRLVKERKPDLLLSFLFRADFVNMLTSVFHNRPALVSARVNTSSTYADDTIQAKINKFLVRRLYPKAEKIISVSEGTKEDLIENFAVARDKHVVIHNPYDIDKIRRLSQEPIDLKLKREETIVALSRFRPIKNIEMLIRAFSGVDADANLVLVGDGEEEQKLHTLTKELGVEDRVIFAGGVDNPYPYLAASSIYISSSRSEGFPNAMVEAMICGCAVVSTDCPSGPREILSPASDPMNLLESGSEYAEYGILVAVDDVAAMQKAICTLLESPKLRSDYSKKAMQRAGDFRLEQVCNSYKNLFSEVIGEHAV